MNMISEAIQKSVGDSGRVAVKKAETNIRRFLFQGGPDTEADDVRFAVGFGDEAVAAVKTAWLDAKTTTEDMEKGWAEKGARIEPPKTEGMGKPKEEPEPEEPVEEEPKKATVKAAALTGMKKAETFKERSLRILRGEQRGGEQRRQRRGEVVALRVVEQRKPEPEAEPDDEPEAER